MKEIQHSLIERDLKNAIYQYLQGLSEESRPRSPDFELVWGARAPGRFEGRDPIVCTVIETRDDE